MAKNKKDRKKNRLLVLLLLLIMMLGFTGVETYAWFTANRKVSMTGVQVGVSTKNGLLISVDGNPDNAGTTINQLDFNEFRANCNASGTCAVTSYSATFQSTPSGHDYSGEANKNNNLFPAKIDNISSAGELDTDGGLKFFSAVVEKIDDSLVNGVEKNNYHMTSATQVTSSSICTAGTGESCNGPYVAFDLYLHLSTSSPISLTDSSSLTTTATTGDLAAKTARVALVYQGTTSSDAVVACGEGQTDGPTNMTDGNAVLSADCNSTGSVYTTNTNAIKANTYLWEPNAAAHNDTTTGDAWGMILYGSNPTGAQTYYGIKKAFRYSDSTYNDTLGKTYGLPFQTYFSGSTEGSQQNGIFNYEGSSSYGYPYVDPDTLARSVQSVNIDGSQFFRKMESNGSLIFRNSPSNRVLFNFGDLPAGVSKFRVYMWIEGMDADTRDEIITYQNDQADANGGSTDLTDMKLALQFAMN